jgi:hypothetical protein
MYQNTKYWISVFLIGWISLTSIGVPFFKMHCRMKTSNSEISVFIPLTDCHESSDSSHKHSCCTESREQKEQSHSKPCCGIEKAFVKANYNSPLYKYDFVVVTLQLCTLPYTYFVLQYTPSTHSHFIVKNPDTFHPPSPTGRQILIFQSMLRC